ncbi:hypothetical protein [Spiroplasma taiwanense]|uniref:Uncharacterized protein n=1 Tax=Spiroplasma taiwanense CT-1 TaxID=1276220 RepID=S5MBK3_9MOLU|nr:hypothetical protein [Spiroplasma taiwanense]AGR41153.1 hypothetical protein STAIW_v1c05240 [Spiroplasma taiwanense CT-1]
MNKNVFFKKINEILTKSGCTQIEFYEPKDVTVEHQFKQIKLESIFKIHYLNTNYKFINLYIKFNEIDFLYKASNQKDLTLYLDLTNKTIEEKQVLLDSYSQRDSQLGLTKLKPSLQFGPILFLEKFKDNEFHIYIEILKNKNILDQSNTKLDFLYFDTDFEFFNNFLPILL